MSRIDNKNDLNEFYKKEKNRFQNLKSDLVNQKNLDDEKLENLQDRLYRMINYLVGRHDWYDEQRQRFLQIGIGLLAAGAAVGAVLARLVGTLNRSSMIFGWVGALILFALGIFLIFLFNLGAERDHPYRYVVDIKSWYFKYNFSSGLKDKISRNKECAKKQVNEIVENLEIFLNRWFLLLDDKYAFIKEDLEEVFVLQLLQHYRSQYIKKMSRALSWLLPIAIIFLLAALLSYSFNYSRQAHMEPDNRKQTQIQNTQNVSPTQSQGFILRQNSQTQTSHFSLTKIRPKKLNEKTFTSSAK